MAPRHRIFALDLGHLGGKVRLDRIPQIAAVYAFAGHDFVCRMDRCTGCGEYQGQGSEDELHWVPKVVTDPLCHRQREGWER